MRPSPDFIFMLTRSDRTVSDALDRLPQVVGAGVRHIGFKDVGLPWESLLDIAAAIRAAGAKVYLEVVSLDAAREAASARAALDLGVDVLMGGVRPEVVAPILRGSPVRYYPFAGRISGHPSVLEGTQEEIVDSARRLLAHPGVHGLDLLAFRSAGDAIELVRRVREAAGEKPVVVAGSLDSASRIGAVVDAGVAAFTVGTAALDAVFPAGQALNAQLAYIQDVAFAASRS